MQNERISTYVFVIVFVITRLGWNGGGHDENSKKKNAKLYKYEAEN